MSNFEDMKITDLKKVIECFTQGSQKTQESARPVKENGRAVIVRARDAGVHFGYLVSYEGRTVILTNARRLWQWKAKSGLALSGVAVNGLQASGSKLDSQVSRVIILDACEVIDCTESAVSSIESFT